VDRRQRKSRAALVGAMVTLVGCKPFAEITIEDVAAEADVARATFYAHFKDKASLLQAATSALAGELTEAVDAQGPRSGTYTGGAVLAIFQHAEQHRNLYRLILSGEGGAPCRSHLVDALEQVTTKVFSRMAAASGRASPVPIQLTVFGIVGAMVLTLEHWLRGDITSETTELAAQFVHSQALGTGWALGFDPDELEFRPPAP